MKQERHQARQSAHTQVSSGSSDGNLGQQSPLIADQGHNDQTDASKGWEFSGQLRAQAGGIHPCHQAEERAKGWLRTGLK